MNVALCRSRRFRWLRTRIPGRETECSIASVKDVGWRKTFQQVTTVNLDRGTPLSGVPSRENAGLGLLNPYVRYVCNFLLFFQALETTNSDECVLCSFRTPPSSCFPILYLSSGIPWGPSKSGFFHHHHQCLHSLSLCPPSVHLPTRSLWASRRSDAFDQTLSP
ncbi:hypothetical protein K474DRAFT_1233863 [Panus rudis PR-1116 ss-1]|nr:hypothetical protein K474DRAFT_1233863 [Panus rudis PR-1116 ss-1]